MLKSYFSENEKISFSFLEAPIYQGQKKFGTCLGPSYFKQFLLNRTFSKACCIEFLSCYQSQSFNKWNFDIYEELSYLTERQARRKKFNFTVGGDHSLSIGTVQGILRAYPNLKVLWIDAHADLNTRKTSLTKSLHGMPLSILLGLDNLSEGLDWFTTFLKPENLIYVGLRDLDPAEKLFLDKLGIQNYSSADFQSENFKTAVQSITKMLSNSVVHISLDSDAFDPTVAFSTGVKVEKGLHLNEVQFLVSEVTRNSDVISYEYVELNPQIFQKSEDIFLTAKLGYQVLRNILVSQMKKRSTYDNNDRFGFSEKSDLFNSSFKLEKSI